MTENSHQQKSDFSRFDQQAPARVFKTEAEADQYLQGHEEWLQENIRRTKRGMPAVKMPTTLSERGLK